MSDRSLIMPSATYDVSHERRRNQRIEEVIRRQAANINDQLRALMVPTCTVSQLPAASAGVRGFVTDATSNTFNAAAVGGGTYAVPVFHDGSAWRVG